MKYDIVLIPTEDGKQVKEEFYNVHVFTEDELQKHEAELLNRHSISERKILRYDER